MSRILDLDYMPMYEDGLKTGAASIINAIISMLERELYKNKGEDIVYEHAIKTIMQKVKDMKID